MKFRSSRFNSAVFPAIIVVPALLQVAQAQLPSRLIFPDSAGNVVVNGNFDELSGSDWTVIANGGKLMVNSVSTSDFSVNIKSGALLTGDESRRNGVEVNSEGYFIRNSGSLDVKSYGVISYVGNTLVENKAGALIQGGIDGIRFSDEKSGWETRITSGVTNEIPGNKVVNDGSILGSSIGINSNGISTLSVDNRAAGTITGNYGPGILAGDGLVVTNEGAILGGAGSDMIWKFDRPIYRNGAGISAGFYSQITNSGEIIATYGSGITTGDGMILENSGSISGLGGNNGFAKTPLIFIGGGGTGVATGSNAVIVNDKSGSIIGTYNGISAGSNLTLTNHGTISGTNSGNGEIGVGYAGVTASRGANIQNDGYISGDQYGIVINSESILTDNTVLPTSNLEFSPVSTITNSGTITGGQAAILLGSGRFFPGFAEAPVSFGENVVNLDFGSNIVGDIRGGLGSDTINFLDGSKTPNQQENIVRGSLFGIEAITKSGTGYAFIGGPGESVQVFADTINVSGGGLIINGSLASQGERKVQVTLTGDGELDGTGAWNADISVGAGGISAGGTNTSLGGDEPLILEKFTKSISGLSNESAIGTLTINGNIGAALPVVDLPVFPLASNAAAAKQSGYIRVDVRPQASVLNGVSHDIIYHGGVGNTFDVTGLDIQIAPTDINKTLTDGKYTIVDSENPLVGVKKIGSVGVHFDSNAPDTGSFLATGSGENDPNTVLTRYFTKIKTEDPIFSAVPFSAAAFDPNNSNLVIKIKHDFESLPGLSKNQAALGAVIDGLVNNPSPILQDFIAALDYSDLGTVQSTLAALDPGNTLGLANSVVNGNYRLHRQTQEHLAAIRGNSRQSTETAPSSKDAKGVITPGASTVSSTGRGNAWGSFSLDGQDNQSGDGGGDYDGTSGAFTAGVDWLVAPSLVAGLVLDGSRGNYDADNYSSDVESFRGALYATYGGALGFYSDALVGFGTHSLDSSIGSAGVLIGSTSNSTGANSFQAMWTAGYTMGDTKVKHGPFGGFEYQNLDVDGYTQGGPLAIRVGGYDVESLRALIGYRVNLDLGKFRPYASAAYAHEFEDGANHTTASLAGVPFRVSGAEQSSAFILTAGTSYTLTEALTLDLGYRGDIATDDGITSNGGSIGVNYSF